MQLSHVLFYTKNMEKTVAFYKDTVGLPLASSDKEFTSFKLGSGFLGIQIVKKKQDVPGYQAAVVSVEDVNEVYKKLKSRGAIIFSDLVQEPWGKNFSIIDPDGNRLEFLQ